MVCECNIKYAWIVFSSFDCNLSSWFNMKEINFLIELLFLYILHSMSFIHTVMQIMTFEYNSIYNICLE